MQLAGEKTLAGADRADDQDRHHAVSRLVHEVVHLAHALRPPEERHAVAAGAHLAAEAREWVRSVWT